MREKPSLFCLYHSRICNTASMIYIWSFKNIWDRLQYYLYLFYQCRIIISFWCIVQTGSCAGEYVKMHNFLCMWKCDGNVCWTMKKERKKLLQRMSRYEFYIKKNVTVRVVNISFTLPYSYTLGNGLGKLTNKNCLNRMFVSILIP